METVVVPGAATSSEEEGPRLDSEWKKFQRTYQRAKSKNHSPDEGRENSRRPSRTSGGRWRGQLAGVLDPA